LRNDYTVAYAFDTGDLIETAKTEKCEYRAECRITLGKVDTAQWMELHGFGYNGKSCFRQQFHPGWLSALPAAIPMGVAEHAVLAQAYQVKQP
jgi:hypothetical protein